MIGPLNVATTCTAQFRNYYYKKERKKKKRKMFRSLRYIDDFFIDGANVRACVNLQPIHIIIQYL